MSNRKASLEQIIERALEQTKEPDPHVLAKRLLPRLSQEHRDELIDSGLVERIRKAIHWDRTRTTMASGAAHATPGPSRWKLSQRVCPAGNWKLLKNCSVDDLYALSANLRGLAAANLQRATEFEERTAEQMCGRSRGLSKFVPALSGRRWTRSVALRPIRCSKSSATTAGTRFSSTRFMCGPAVRPCLVNDGFSGRVILQIRRAEDVCTADGFA